MWLAFQKSIGGTKDKKKLALSYRSGKRRILEIGCSVGNVSDAFRNLPNIYFLGLDIDAKAIGKARRRFSSLPNFFFICTGLEDLAEEMDNAFEYIIFAGMLHHVNDDKAITMLRAASRLCAPKGNILIFDPDALRDDDNLIFRAFYRIEQGRFLRHHAELKALVLKAGLKVIEDKTVPIRPGLPGLPVVARFSVILLSG